MDITVYLPDDIAQRAKAQNVNLSRVLRDALTAQFAKEDAVSATLEEARKVSLELRTEEGRPYRGSMDATLIGEDATAGTAVYLRLNGEVICYRPDDRQFWTLTDPERELLTLLPTAQYIAAMDAIGIVPEVDLDAGLVSVVSGAPAAPPSPKTARRTRLRAVPGDLVEPPVRVIKRLTGHGSSPIDNTPAAELSPSPTSPEAEAVSEADATTEQETGSP